ncbi:hypothetical protein GCM10009839_37850 [Catenulispora yoronensis]|uniref:YcxB-like C-terminal domain-containing protein n=1 Tax=Catenulispora yoronensis TaxID=450799 RepID=A0ABP5FTH5_9ACTN
MEVTGEYLLSAQEYGSGMKVILRGRRRFVSWLFATPAAVCGAVLLATGHPAFGVYGLAIALLTVCAWRIEAARANLAFKRRRGRTPLTVSFTDDGVTTKTLQGASAHRPWHGFTKAVETGHVFVLYVSTGHALIVPKRPFSSIDTERISSLLRAAELLSR